MVEYRLAKARVAGSNPVSRFYVLRGKPGGIEGFPFFVSKYNREEPEEGKGEESW